MAFVECLKTMLAQLDLVKVPFVSFHGNTDMLCNVEGSRLLFEHASSSDKKLVEVPNAAHNLLLDAKSVRTRVLSEVVDWFNQRAP